MNFKQNVTISTKSVQYLNLSSSPQREVVPPRRAPLHYGSRPVLHEWTRAAGGGLSCPELAAPANNKSNFGTRRYFNLPGAGRPQSRVADA